MHREPVLDFGNLACPGVLSTTGDFGFFETAFLDLSDFHTFGFSDSGIGIGEAETTAACTVMWPMRSVVLLPTAACTVMAPMRSVGFRVRRAPAGQ